MLSAGSKIGPYEVVAPIGSGGMGEVYRARDSRLGRQVALKILLEAFATDAGRMARFEREAKLLAALSHPNIATIHGLEDSAATRALVMELVEGPTLADRIRQGPIPLDEALPIARQICDALEFAHERGIIHRDLKPANVKVTPDDAVKVLDFGLAKALEGDPASADIATSPTISRMATQAGILLGTAAYMSPEQAKGKSVDRRADIWAFGCVLYEMLSGKMPFHGETVTDTLAAVIKEEPDWSLLPPDTPARVRVLLRRCLQKDPKQRLRDIGDARISIDEVLSGAPDALAPAAAAAGPRSSRRALTIGIAAVALIVIAAAAVAFLYLHPKSAPVAAEVRFQVPLPDKTTFTGGSPAISPDGRTLAFVLSGAGGANRIWVRSVQSFDAHPIEGTDGADGWLIWSPDSSALAFAASGKLWKVDLSGGPPQELCSAGLVIGGAWTQDHKIIFSLSGLLTEIPDSGGPLAPVGISGGFPAMLPDDRHFVYALGPPGSPGSGIYLAARHSKPDEKPTLLSPDTGPPSFVLSSDPGLGYVMFVHPSSTSPGGTIMALPFNLRTYQMAGEALPVLSDAAVFSASRNALVFWGGSSVISGPARGNIEGRLTWFDRQGKILDAFGDPGVYRTLAISPDGKRVAFDRSDSNVQARRDLWLYDLSRGVSTRFTFDAAFAGAPVWSPDGARIAFTSNKSGGFDLWEKASNLAGDEHQIFKSTVASVPSSWSRDGRFLLFYHATPPSQIWALPVDAPGGQPISVAQSEFNQAIGRFSPDGRWIVYESNESGKNEVYVRPFDPAASGSQSAQGKWMVSKGGGGSPLWSRDGREIFYLSSDGMAVAVGVSTSGIFQAGIPKPLFKVPPGLVFWDVSPDAKRFLIPAPEASNGSQPFNVVLNWQSNLKK